MSTLRIVRTSPEFLSLVLAFVRSPKDHESATLAAHRLLQFFFLQLFDVLSVLLVGVPGFFPRKKTNPL